MGIFAMSASGRKDDNRRFKEISIIWSIKN
jgi:hypothetical protein